MSGVGVLGRRSRRRTHPEHRPRRGMLAGQGPGGLGQRGGRPKPRVFSVFTLMPQQLLLWRRLGPDTRRQVADQTAPSCAGTRAPPAGQQGPSEPDSHVRAGTRSAERPPEDLSDGGSSDKCNQETPAALATASPLAEGKPSLMSSFSPSDCRRKPFHYKETE